ncbi:MAG: EAL domain-containing protein [Polaromonas sp.]|nr:EAL domain-containing protein [Polaromonas sp.]
MTGGPFQPAPVSHQSAAMIGGQLSLQPQLSMYAEDFQEILGRHHELERRHNNLKAAYSRLSEAGEVLGRLTRLSGELYLMFDAEGHIHCACDNARSVFMLDECKVERVQELMAPFHLTHLEMLLRGTVDGNPDFTSGHTEFVLYPGGDPDLARLFASSFLSLSVGRAAQTCWIIRDLSAETGESPDPAHQSGRYSALHQGAMAVNPQGQIIAVDRAFSDTTGYTNEDLQGQVPAMLRSAGGNPVFQDILGAELQANGRWRGEITTLRKNEPPLRQWLCITAVRDNNLQAVAYIAVLADRALMMSAERTVLDSACHDTVTGLPNFSLFQERAGQKMVGAWRGGAGVALLCIGLDRFQSTQTLADSASADTVLQTVSARLQEVIRGCDIITHAAPDRFYVLLVGALDQTAVADIASRMISAVAVPIPVRNQKRVIGASIGCALFPGGGMDTPALLKKAAAAMLLARKDGGNRYRMYSHPLPAVPAVRHNALEHDFAAALSKEELYLAYQPLVASDGHCQLLACEVQLRWNHAWLGDLAWPERGAPGEVGDSDIDAGVWMIKTACRQLRNWQALGLGEMRLVINLTAGQVTSHQTADALAEILTETGIAPRCLELTLTEAQNLTIHGSGLDSLARLRKTGVRIVLRNFGTWYAELAQIQARPFDQLKIERSFVHDAVLEKPVGSRWEWVVGMGVTMRLDLIAEPDADPPQIELLTARYGHLTQGYLKGRPMIPSTFSYWAFEKQHLLPGSVIPGQGA